MNSGDYHRPIRPPRGSKTPKETTGHLMKIISTLSVSQDNADRDKEKKKLEKEYNDSDKKLNHLVEDHREDLLDIVQAFRKVHASVGVSKSKCHEMKGMLDRCKNQLHCKRDELKRLWLEVVEHKRVLHMLKEIDALISVPERIDFFLKNKMYLEATELLVSSNQLLETSLSDVDALKELRIELNLKQEGLHHTLVQELQTLLYITSTSPILTRFKRHGSGRLRNEPKIPNLWTETLSGSTTDLNQTDTSTTSTSSWEQSSWSEEESVWKLEPSTSNSISVIVNCVTLLHRISDTVEILEERCSKELLAIVQRTTQHVTESVQNATISSTESSLGSILNKEQQYLLLDLFELVFEQFKYVSSCHRELLNELQNKINEDKLENERKYEMADIWSKIQAVLEILIGGYLDIHNSTSSHPSAPSSFSSVPSAVDMNSYFLRKRPTRPKNYALFKFDCSSHALNMKTYLQEQKEAQKEKGNFESFDSETQVFICPPSNKNITTIFKPLMKFISEIETELNIEPDATCPLRTFTFGCVKVFLGQISVEIANLVEHASKSLESWRTCSDPDQLNDIGVITTVLYSAVCVDNILKEIMELINSLPKHSVHFIHLLFNVLQNYRESCQVAYSSLIQPHSEDKRIISSSWARDKDISRLLRSLPNWTNLKETESSDFEESPEEVRLRNKKESEILISNLSGDTLISQHEILADSHHLRNLGLLHESLDWLVNRILNFISTLPKTAEDSTIENEDEEISVVPENLIEGLMQIKKDYENLADTCLLVLHLEVRVHCFYYLQSLAIQGCYATRLDNQEPDPEIIKLSTDLGKIDESLQLVLKPANVKYIFEGLGELISTILINSINKIKRINENGVKKMIRNIHALQQNLTGITMSREVALDRARQYYDLLNYSPEEILNLIVENGPQFQELEYSAAFNLWQRSHPCTDSNLSMNTYLERLHQILNEVAVSV